ncbi:MAG: S-layer homology domain-containing protein [Sedimentibacter sp.]|uniref:S-layer homology domain-containing protein n=1 Tax=Sedimentibacter sp. TaxID=1960295 RepID=UPI0031598342
MNKNVFKKVVCLVIALMMMMPALPSSIVSASTVTYTDAQVSELFDGNDFTQTISSTNEHSKVAAFWYDNSSPKNLYVAFTAHDTKTVQFIEFDGVRITAEVKSEHPDDETLVVKGTTFLVSDYITKNASQHHWVIVNLGNRTLPADGNFTIGADLGAGGHSFTGTSATIIVLYYTVTYQPGDHGTFAEQSTPNLTYGDATPAAPDAENNHESGWTFAGWSPAVAATVTGNATYVATWTQDGYTVTYQPGDHGTFAEQSTPNLTYGDATPAAPDAENNHDNGWTFAGWSPAVAATVTGNATYVATWTQDKYTVTYQPGDHGTFAEQSTPNLIYGDATPTAPDAENNHESGWTFAGWSPAVAATVTGNATYVATWTQDGYTVTYQPGDHGTFAEQSTPNLTYGDVTPAAPDAENNHDNGWTFAGWSPAVAATVTGNATYVATWTQDKYTVTYQSGDHGTFAEQSTPNLTYGDVTPAAPDAENNHESGWTFAGWSPAVAATVTENATYVATWTQDKYTVTYQPGDHGTFAEQSTPNLIYGDVTPAAPDAENNHESGWTFAGWSPAVAATVTGNATYVATWTQEGYTVTYQPGDHGTFAEQSTPNLTYGDVTPAAPDAENNHDNGWTFAGWSPAVAATVTGNATYVATWTQDKYTVTYQPGDHGTFAEQSTPNLTYGDVTPAAPDAENNHESGWTFTGWSPAVAATVTGNATYVAQYSSTEMKVPVHKQWISDYEQPQYMSLVASSVQKPDSITLHLYDGNDDLIDSITIEPQYIEGWEYWEGEFSLPNKVSEEEFEQYYVIEDELDDYFAIVNNWGTSDGFGVYNIEAIHVPVTKVWDGPTGKEVTVTLLDANKESTGLTLTLNAENKWTDSFKLPKYEMSGDGYWDFNVIDYSEYTVAESGVIGYTPEISGDVYEGFVVTNKVNEVAYKVNYLDIDTGLSVVPSVDKFGAFGEEVTEIAQDVENYNIVGSASITVTLNEDENVINFYYSKYDVIESNLHKVNWMYETGYNTYAYNQRYSKNGTGTPAESDITSYVQLHYDSGYTYVKREISTKTDKETIIVEVPSESVTTGSAVTASAIKLVTTTTVNLYYDMDRDDDDDDDDDEDIPDNDVPLADLEKLDHFAYVIGYPEGDIRPLNNITREEVAMIFYRLLTDESRNSLLSDYNPFTDLENHGWSNRAISTLYNAGIIKGYPDGTFRPSDPISRAEFATIAAKFDKLELNNTSKFTDIFGHWAEKYITSSENKGWIKGYPDLTFKPEQDITRAEAMTLINNVLGRVVPEENIHPDSMFWPDIKSSDWYYEAVMEATNSHNYVIEDDKDELWTGLKPNKVWP